MRDDIAKSGYTTDQIITLASIIQAEAANTDDIRAISAIFAQPTENGASMTSTRWTGTPQFIIRTKIANDAPEGLQVPVLPRMTTGLAWQARFATRS